MADENDDPSLDPRGASLEDLVELCRELNALGARYIVVGGFAIRAAGYLRETYDIDLIVDLEPENEAKVLKSLEYLPDKAIRELQPGEIAQFTVVRVNDEVTVDLMKSACGLTYIDLAQDVVLREVGGVVIPFASPKQLWLMKQTHREKDALDRLFLKQLLGDDLPPTPPRPPL